MQLATSLQVDFKLATAVAIPLSFAKLYMPCKTIAVILMIAITVGCERANDPKVKSTLIDDWSAVGLPQEDPVCEIVFPTTLERETQKFTGVKADIFSYETDTLSASLSVMRHSLRNWTDEEEQRILNGTVDGAIRGCGGVLKTQKTITVGQSRGLECDIRVDAEGKEYKLLMRFIATEPNILHVQWVQELDKFDQIAADQIMDSLILLNRQSEQGGADQPTTAPQLEPTENSTPNPESKPRAQ